MLMDGQDAAGSNPFQDGTVNLSEWQLSQPMGCQSLG